MEHPLDESWGYQTTGYFAADARASAAPTTCATSSTACHQAGIGVLLDWVPGHFPRDDFALAHFDGSASTSTRTRAEGRAPTGARMSSTTGATRCAASCSPAPLLAGGVPFRRPARRRRGLDALPRLLAQGRRVACPTCTAGARTSRPSTSCASSTSWCMAIFPARCDRRGIHRLADGVAADASGRPRLLDEVEHGLDERHAGLPGHDPVHRRFHHSQLTFGQLYAYSENFVLPLSHDEVVHGKGSLSARCRATTGRSSPTCACCSPTR
jgi:1,4-alpha-glucan branching enzyme